MTELKFKPGPDATCNNLASPTLQINHQPHYTECPPQWLSGKESACNAGDAVSIPGSGRAPEEGNDYPLQQSCLENSMDRRAWQAPGVKKSSTPEQLTHSSLEHLAVL